MSKILAALTVFSFAFLETNTALAADKIEQLEAKPFKGNWTDSFQTTTPFGIVTHTPTAVKYGFMTVGKELMMSKGSSINGYVFSADLRLSVDSSREEFVAALIAAKIYKK